MYKAEKYKKGKCLWHVRRSWHYQPFFFFFFRFTSFFSKKGASFFLSWRFNFSFLIFWTCFPSRKPNFAIKGVNAHRKCATFSHSQNRSSRYVRLHIILTIFFLTMQMLSCIRLKGWGREHRWRTNLSYFSFLVRRPKILSNEKGKQKREKEKVTWEQ